MASGGSWAVRYMVVIIVAVVLANALGSASSSPTRPWESGG